MSVYEAVREDPNMKEARLLKILTAEMLPPRKKKERGRNLKQPNVVFSQHSFHKQMASFYHLVQKWV